MFVGYVHITVSHTEATLWHQKTAAVFIFGELFKSHVSFTKFVCFTDVPPKGTTQGEKGGGTN